MWFATPFWTVPDWERGVGRPTPHWVVPVRLGPRPKLCLTRLISSPVSAVATSCLGAPCAGQAVLEWFAWMCRRGLLDFDFDFTDRFRGSSLLDRLYLSDVLSFEVVIFFPSRVC